MRADGKECMPYESREQSQVGDTFIHNDAIWFVFTLEISAHIARVHNELFSFETHYSIARRSLPNIFK